LYNYAQLYPLAVTKTDSSGNTSLLTGLGDLVVWASKGGFYGYLEAVLRIFSIFAVEEIWVVNHNERKLWH
jgi:hypothetical protein